MSVIRGGDITVDQLRDNTLSDLIETFDHEGERYVEVFLASALETANEHLETHGKELKEVPAIEYDPHRSGVAYDPLHQDGQVLIIGGPRGILQGGYQTLQNRGMIEHTSLLNILTKGLVHSYNQQLVNEHFKTQGSAAGRSETDGIQLYDKFRLLVTPVDEGFAQMYSLYIDGDITDGELRQAYIEAWVRWYQETDTDFDLKLFRAVAYTLSDRATEVEGPAKEVLTHMMDIQEPLIRDEQVSLISSRADLAP